MKKSLIALLVALIPQFTAWGWPMWPNIIQAIFRTLSILGTIALFVILIMLYRENSALRKQKSKWKDTPSGTIISKTETTDTGSKVISKITKEVKKL
jgi:hypothetical protein